MHEILYLDGFTKPPPIRTHVRWMIRRDMPDVLALDQQYNGGRGWTEEQVLTALRERNTIGMVCELTGKDRLGGFMLYSLHPEYLELLKIAAGGEVMDVLIDKLISKLSSHRRTRIEFDVWEGDLPLQIYLKNRGFRAVSVWDDTYHFVWEIQ